LLKHALLKDGGDVKFNRSYLALLASCALAAFAVALALATLFAGAAVAFTTGRSADNEQAEKSVPPNQDGPSDKTESSGLKSLSGMVTDSHCMGRHVRYPDKSPMECAKMCARSGSSYMLVDGDKKYVLQGGDLALDKVAAQRAVVKGILTGDTLKVASVTPQ
jgi:hypothetical protein